MYNKGKQFENHFFIYGPNVKKMYILGLFWGPWEGLQWSDWAYLSLQLSSHPYLCTCEIRKQSDKTFLSLNPKYEKIIFFFIFGGSWGGLTSNPGERKFRGGPGWPINNPTGPILLPRHPLTYINLHIKYGSNPIRIF